MAASFIWRSDVQTRRYGEAEQSDLAAACEVIDRADGTAAQAVDYGDVSAERLSDARLYAIAAADRGGVAGTATS